MRADSGDKGFPSSQTIKSETSSTTPVQHERRINIKTNLSFLHITHERQQTKVSK